MNKKRVSAALLTLVILAVSLRTIGPWSVVFPGAGRVRLLDADSYFHLRQARLTLDTFPGLPRIDAGVAFPDAQRSDATGLFDLGLAAAGKLTGASGDDASLARTAAWVPVALYAAVLLALFALARRALSPAWALAAVALFVCHPALSLPPTQLGFVDHHVAEMLLAVLSTLGLVWLLQRSERPVAGASQPGPPTSLAAFAWRDLPDSLLAAAPLVTFLFTWSGAALHVAILGVVAVTAIFLRIGTGDDARPFARATACFGASALVLSSLLAALSPDLVIAPHSMTFATRGLIGLVAAGLLLPLLRARLAALTGPRGQLAAIVAPLACAALSYLTLTTQGRKLVEILLTPKMLLVAEHRDVTLAYYLSVLGLAGLCAPLALPLGIVRAVRTRDAAALVLATAGSIHVALWAITRDYGYQAAVWCALLAALALHELADLLPARVSGRFAAAALACALALPLVPGSPVLHPWATAHLAGTVVQVDAAWEEAMAWMRKETSDDPHFGVASSWDRGNLVAELGRRRSSWARYPMRECAEWFLETDAVQARKKLCPRCTGSDRVRWIALDGLSVADKFLNWAELAGRGIDDFLNTASELKVRDVTMRPATYGVPWRAAVSVRLYYLDGEGLPDYRLAYETADQSCHYFRLRPRNVQRVSLRVADASAAGIALPEPGATTVMPDGVAHDVSRHATVKIFEVVAGAYIAGRAEPGTVMSVTLDLEVATTHRKFTFRQNVRTDPGGVFVFRVPYNTKRPVAPEAIPAVRALGPYRVFSGPQAVTVEIGEADVQEGRTVRI